MRDFEALEKQVTLDEYETGRNMFNILRERGMSVSKAAGIVYRAGRLDGSKQNKDRFGKEITRLHGIIRELKQSPPEANAETGEPTEGKISLSGLAEAEEGSTTDE